MPQRAAATKKMELYSRRREMYRLHIAELQISEIIERLSVKYRVSKRVLWEDWQKRSQWVYDVFDLEPAQAPRST
jgi:transposase